MEATETSNKALFLFQAARLLAISNEKLVLLSAKTKLPLLSMPSHDLYQWSAMGHDGLVLEFRGSKPWTLLTPSVDSLKQLTTALWEVIDVGGGGGGGPGGVGGGGATGGKSMMHDGVAGAHIQRDILDFGK